MWGQLSNLTQQIATKAGQLVELDDSETEEGYKREENSDGPELAPGPTVRW